MPRHIAVDVYPSFVRFDGAIVDNQDLDATIQEYRQIGRPFKVQFVCGFCTPERKAQVSKVLGVEV